MENGSQKIGLRIAAGFLVAITIIVAVFASGITLPSQKVRTGRLTVLLMDAPVDLEELYVTITGLEVHKVGQDGEWIPLMDEGDEIRFDLLKYQGTETLTLASEIIEAGTYNKIRMKVSGASAIFAAGTEEAEKNPHTLTVPSGKIEVITKFELGNGDPDDDDAITVLIDMEPDWVAISNLKHLRPVLKASISDETPQPTATIGED